MFNSWLFIIFSLLCYKGSVKVVESVWFVSSGVFILQLNIFFLPALINSFSVWMALLSFPFFLFTFYPPILISLFCSNENGKRYRHKVIVNCVCMSSSVFFFFYWTSIITKNRDLNEDFLKYDRSIIIFNDGTKF